jgi:hypothetical protein
MTTDELAVEDRLRLRGTTFHNKASELFDKLCGWIAGIGRERHAQLNRFRANRRGGLQRGD